MIEWIRRYFEPPEVAACRKAVLEVEPLFPANIAFAPYVLALVKQRVESRRWRQHIVSSFRNGTTPRDYVLASVLDVAQPMLTSGEYHVWSGVLGMEDGGIEYAFDAALAELVKSRFVSEQYARERKAFVSEAIARVG